MSKKKNKGKRKVRIEFRKNQQTRRRENDLTRQYEADLLNDDMDSKESVTGKGDLSRKRTIVSEGSETAAENSGDVVLSVDESVCQPGRVMNAHGLNCTVEAEDGTRYQCATRRLLKSLHSDQRQVVVTGDHVQFRPVNESEGMIERIEPRHGILSRTSKQRQHILVSNVDQLLIVTSAAEPLIKPGLIDRFLISAEQGRIRPIICINKMDLVEPAHLQPLAGVYSSLGYDVVLISVKMGWNIDRLRNRLRGRQTVFSGQSGVGKSSLLNAIEPGLGLRVTAVSSENQKGKHTTTSATMYPLEMGGYVVDTPGIRQFELWDVIPEELPAFFPEFRPFINGCKFPNCTHTHEADCAVKDAVADHLVDTRRYESYLHLFHGDMI